MIPAKAPAEIAPIAPAFNESFKLLPANKEVPAEAIKPWVAMSTAGAAVVPHSAVAAGPAIKNSAVPMTILPIVEEANFLIAFPIFLKTLPMALRKNSGSPVTGLIVPLPPRDFKRRISSGVT